MSEMSVDQVLAQMRAITQSSAAPENVAAQRPDFSELLKDSIAQVNDLQQNASEMKTAFETGQNAADISEVMVAVQKASVSFEAVVEVRNKLLTAYQEVMNMQV